jgi:asparagine synthase (glutamine-hydrolysing)
VLRPPHSCGRVSGILGVAHWRGGPAEEATLWRMAEAAAHRGPDGRGFWLNGKVGLGFLALQLTAESIDETEPRSRDGLAVVADARIDNRPQLLPVLRRGGALRHDAPSDAELILATYLAWGADCVHHLEGDFAFVLWDGPQQRLFGARDPMGMRPLYYRNESGRFLFASEVKQILADPDVSARLFEPALLAHIAGPYGRPEWSFYQGILQLAPGHAFTASSDGVEIRRFWELDPEARIRYRRDGDYGDHFRSLFRDAVACRLRSHRPVGLLLSGGVDSGSIASMAGWLMERGEAPPPGFRSYCWAFDELRDGDERGVSDVIADTYDLDRAYIPADEGWPLQGYPGYAPDRDDPHLWPYQPLHDRSLDRARADGMGAVMTGDRGDEVVGDWVYDPPGMFLAGRWLLLRKELRALGQPGWRGLKRRVLRPLLKPQSAHWRPYPLAPWVPQQAASRWGLEELARTREPGLFRDPARQLRYERIFCLPGMRIALANGRRRAARGLGFDDPWSDSRIARFVLSIPPWQVQRVTAQKHLAREGLRGIVPEEVRMRTGKTIPVGLFDRGLKERAVETVRDLLRNPMAAELGLLDADRVRQEYEEFLTGRTPKHDFWWPITAEFWLRKHWR